MIRIRILEKKLNEGKDKKKKINFVDPEPEENWDAIGWTPNMVDKIKDYDLIWISPQEFLEKVDPSFTKGSVAHSNKSDEFLMSAIQNKRKFAPLQMWPLRRHGDVMQHEGRHRALLAKSIGMNRVPVIVWKK